MRFASILPLILLTLVARARAADWTPPEDNKLTEKQVLSYIAGVKEFMDAAKATEQAAAATKTDLGKIALAMQASEKYKAIIAKHGMDDAQWQWVAEKVWEAYSAGEMAGVFQQAGSDMDKAQKDMADKLKADQASLAAHEKAAKEGKRVLTAEQREQLVEQYKNEKEEADNEAKSAGEEARTAADDAAQAIKDTQAAEAEAKNPPKDLSEEDRASFVEEKKNLARDRRAAVEEANNNQKDALKRQAEAQVRAAAAAKRMAAPEVPVGDEEKAEVAKENEDNIQRLKEEIKGQEEALKMLKEAAVEQQKSLGEMNQKIPAQNIELVRKHRDEFLNAFGQDPKATEK